jgi:dihydrolipoamide dehydrogenase
LVKGVESLLKARKIQLVTGSAKFIGTKSVLVSTPGKGERIITAKNIIIATGSKPAKPTIPGIDGKNVITSNEALNFEGLPKSIAIIGGGVIGMEMSDVYSGFGVKVTVIEALERIVPNMDTEVSEEFLRNKSKKVDIYTSARVQSITDTKDKKKRVEFIKDENIAEVVVEKVLVAVGRTCNTGLLDLQEIGVGTEQSRVVIDENFETNVSGVYCIGDANGKMMLAHVASAQGIFVAELIMGKRCIISQDIVPNCIYTNPEIASVGMTEEEAKDKGIEYKVGKFRFRANGRSLILDKGEGFVKIIGSKKHNEVLGVHIIGPYATEMIAECVAVMTLEGCVEDIANIIHAHPTVSESIKEAAEDFLGGAIHSV